MGAQEQADKAVAELMRTRFPLHGRNFKKKGRTFLPRWCRPEGGIDAPYGRAFPRKSFKPFGKSPGHTFEPLAQLYVYDKSEPDRPMIVRVDDVEAAKDYIRVLQEFIAYKEAETTE
jgi:hypothetical protein